jgi:hypothetical protein
VRERERKRRGGEEKKRRRRGDGRLFCTEHRRQHIRGQRTCATYAMRPPTLTEPSVRVMWPMRALRKEDLPLPTLPTICTQEEGGGARVQG